MSIECHHRLYGACPACRQKVLDGRKQHDEDWYRETGHCGYCGDPGVFCTCTEADPCGCRDLHDMGSARLPGALEAFMPAVVQIEQDDLFGGAP